MNNIDGTEWIERIRMGDKAYLNRFFDQYSRILYSFFYHQTGDASLSEDLMQSVFYRIVKYKDKFKADGKLKSWVFSIARNVLNDNFRKRKRRMQEQKYADGLEFQADPYKNIHKKEEKRLLHLAIQQLDEEKREAILLVKIQEMKYKEVAKMLNTPESTIKVRVFRALKELKEIYQKMEQE